MLSGTHLASLLIAHEDDMPIVKKILQSVLTEQQRSEFLNCVRKIYLIINTFFNVYFSLYS